MDLQYCQSRQAGACLNFKEVRMTEKAVTRTVSIPAEMDRRLVAFASEVRRPVSWVVQDALQTYLGGDASQTAAAGNQQVEVEQWMR